MINLTAAIFELEGEINKREWAFYHEIKPYKDSLEQLRKINEACENCEGRGWVLRQRACAEDDRPDPNDPRDRLECPVCHGSGAKNEKISN